MRGIVNVGTYFDYSGKIRNRVLEFKNMSDISYLSSNIEFVEAEVVFINASDKAFSYHYLTKANFPNLKEIWFNSYFDIQVLDRFKIPIYFSDQYARISFPLSFKDPSSWIHRSLTIVPENQIKSELNKYKEETLLKD
jgi:hypothetical protein